jgi:hypothetical protein
LKGAIVRRAKKEIKAVLHLPDNEQAIRQFEKKLCDFYASQIEKRISSFPKAKKIEVIDAIISHYDSSGIIEEIA